MNREFLQLAQTYNPAKHGIGGWFVSEKLDGMRALWDGGFTRGTLAMNIPFANTEKDDRLREYPLATGLWSRYGKVIRAPEWWLNNLPEGVCLDGELYLGPGQFQETMSIVKQHHPDMRWSQIKFAAFDMPSYDNLFMDGNINNPQMKKYISFSEIYKSYPQVNEIRRFHQVVNDLPRHLNTSGVVYQHWQEQLPYQTQAAIDRMEELMDIVLNRGGEGLILRKPESIWVPKRTWDLLKVKPMNDDEGTVAGYVWGKGKYEGLMGAMIVDWHGVVFELSGFTDAERVLVGKTTGYKACGLPGEKVKTDISESKHFPVGSKVTFKYRELTDAGIPKEARYYRKSPN